MDKPLLIALGIVVAICSVILVGCKAPDPEHDFKDLSEYNDCMCVQKNGKWHKTHDETVKWGLVVIKCKDWKRPERVKTWYWYYDRVAEGRDIQVRSNFGM